MAFQNVKTTVVLKDADSGLASGEVLFPLQELRLPSKNSILRSAFASLESKDLLSDDGFAIFFFKKNTNELGTQYSANSISHADWRENEFLGAVQVNGAPDTSALTNLSVADIMQYGDADSAAKYGAGSLDVALSSQNPDGIIYYAAVINEVEGTGPVIGAGDIIDFNFSFEY